jgi:HEAT repeat protein
MLVRPDEQLGVCRVAVWSLRQVDPDAGGTLLRFLADDRWPVRVWAARALGGLREKRAVMPLIDLLHDSQVAVRMAAATALGKLRDPRAIEPLVAHLESIPSTEFHERYQIASVVGRLDAALAVEPLLDLLATADLRIRIGAVHALGLYGDARALPVLAAVRRTSTVADRRLQDLAGAAAWAIKRIEDRLRSPPGW